MRSSSAGRVTVLGSCVVLVTVVVVGCAESPESVDDAGASSPSQGSTDDGSTYAYDGGNGYSLAPDAGATFPSEGGTTRPFGDGGPRSAAPCAANGTFPISANYPFLPINSSLTMYECDPTGMEGKTSQPAPLVLALHGYTQGAYEAPAASWSAPPGEPSTWGYIDTTQWATLAEAYGFYVVFPSTGNATNPNQPDTTARSFHWYSGWEDDGISGTTPAFIARGNDDEAAIMAMVTQMQQTHNIDASRIFISGLSAGGAMANLMIAAYPDVFAGAASFEGVAVGCDEDCAALGQAPPNGTWSWPGNHPSSAITNLLPSVWSNPSAPKPKLIIFQGMIDIAVTPDNEQDLVQQFAGAYGISTTPTTPTTTYKGQNYTVYGGGQMATMEMPAIGHGTPVQPGPVQSTTPFFVVGAPPGPDQGGWDPMPSKDMVDNVNLVQDWTNTVGIWGMYEAARFWGIVP